MRPISQYSVWVLLTLSAVVACRVKDNGLGAGGHTDEANAAEAPEPGGGGRKAIPGSGGMVNPGRGGASGGTVGTGGSVSGQGGSVSGAGGMFGGDGGARPGAGGTSPDGSVGGAMSGSGGSMGSGGASVVDAGRDQARPVDLVRSDTSADLLPMSSEGLVTCGFSQCSISSASCCASAPQASICRANALDCDNGLRRRCDGAEDCRGNDVCCGKFEQGKPGLFESSCQSSNECRGGSEAILCNAHSDCPVNLSRCCMQMVSGYTFHICRRDCN